MATYINPPIDVDATELESMVYDYIQTFFPDFEPNEPHLSVVTTEAFMQQVADNRSLATDVHPAIFRYFGSLIGAVPQEGAPATGTVTITARDNLGYEWGPGDLAFRIQVSGDQFIGFSNTEVVTINPGSTVLAGVPIEAVTEGAEGNQSGPIEFLTVEDTIVSVSLDAPTENGADEEDEDDFLDKLTTRLQLLKDGPVLPEDFALYTKVMFPTVDRVLALDTYDPDTDTFENEKFVTVVPIDADGADLVGIHTAIKQKLEEVREWNFQPRVMSPTYTAITVAAQIVPLPGISSAFAIASATQAVKDYLHPRNWGRPVRPGGSVSDEWILDGYDRVRFSEIITVINNADGVNYIVNDEVVINGGTNTTLFLAGQAPLPAINPTVTITVPA